MSALCLAAPTMLLAQDELKKPNILILFTDQHRADVMGYENHPDVYTPNLDRMAENGVVYQRAYCQDAISSPSRASMFTGYYPRTIGCLDNSVGTTSVMKQAVSIQQALQDNGYETYAFGKRHLHDNADQGWTLHKSHLANESPEDNYVKWVEKQGCAEEFGEDWAAEFGQFPPGNSLSGKKYPTADMGTRMTKLKENQTMEAYSALNTIQLIRNRKNTDKPFFCFTSFYRPHQPYNPLKKYLAMYDVTHWGKGTKKKDGIVKPMSLNQPAESLPPFLANQRDDINGIWCLGKAAKNEQLYRNYIGSYYALVTEIDYWIGKIFDELEANDMLDNTIVIYASDHGDFVGSHGMIEKSAVGHNVYEETLRIPLIFYWKNKFKHVMNTEDLVGLIDIYPTLLDLIDADMPKLKYPLQGLSLKNNLIKGEKVDRKYMVSENWSQATVITKDYKLGIWLDPYPQPQWKDFRSFGDMLFDRRKDPYELNNLVEFSSYDNIRRKLWNFFKDFEKETVDVGKVEIIKMLEK